MARLPRVSRTLPPFLAVVIALALALQAMPAHALGPSAPPAVTFRGVWVNTRSSEAFRAVDEGIPQLYTSIQIRIPGGDVVKDVASVTITLPDGVTQFEIPKNHLDLGFEFEHFLNLSQAGVAGFPAGTYTFRVTDVLGGVTTVTDTLSPITPLLPTTLLSVSTAVKVSDFPGEIFALNLPAEPAPTVTWATVAGAAVHRLVVRTLSGPDIFVHATSAGSSTLPGGVMVPGRIYRFLLRAESSASGLPTADSRSEREIRIVTLGPEVTVSASPGTVQAGESVVFSARLVNTGPPIVVNAQAWLGRPDGVVEQIASLEGLALANSSALPNTDLFNGPFASRMFTGGEPNGNYVLGARLSDPATGETIARASFRFQK